MSQIQISPLQEDSPCTTLAAIAGTTLSAATAAHMTPIQRIAYLNPLTTPDQGDERYFSRLGLFCAIGLTVNKCVDAMHGRPVWLASLSVRDTQGRIMRALDWPRDKLNMAEELLAQALDGVGDSESERVFRMCITLCYHRALTDEEAAGLPQWWKDAPPSRLAGGPVEVLRAKGRPGLPSTAPCAKPTKELVSLEAPYPWIPRDCGHCPSCLARAELKRSLAS